MDKEKLGDLSDSILSVSCNCLNAICMFINNERTIKQAKSSKSSKSPVPKTSEVAAVELNEILPVEEFENAEIVVDQNAIILDEPIQADEEAKDSSSGEAEPSSSDNADGEEYGTESLSDPEQYEEGWEEEDPARQTLEQLMMDAAR